MELLFRTLEVLGLSLQVVLVFLLVGLFRQYTLLLTYAVAQLASAILEVYVSNRYGRDAQIFSTVYWTDEVLLDFLRFSLVIALAYRLSEGSAAPAVKKLLIAVVVVAVALPFMLPGGELFGTRWFNRTSQMLNFGGAIMNLALWTVLLGSKRRDPQLLLVSAGVGISVTGAAIAWGVRLLVRDQDWWAPNLFLILSYLAGVLIWCWAFRPGTQPREQAHGGAPSGA